MSKQEETRTAEEIAATWNPPAEDNGIILAVGEPVPEGWGLATNAANNGLTVDGAVPVDKGGEDANSRGEFVPYRKRSKSELQDEARDRGLAVSGSKQDLIDRLVDHDVNGDDDADEAEDDDEDDESEE